MRIIEKSGRGFWTKWARWRYLAVPVRAGAAFYLRKMDEFIAKRAADPEMLSVPGGTTGMVAFEWRRSVAATRIDDPKTFVNGVYRRIIASRSGCLDFLFWVNGQDFSITNLTVTSADQGPDHKTVAAKFDNIDRPEEIRFDFVRNGRRWLLDEVRTLRNSFCSTSTAACEL